MFFHIITSFPVFVKRLQRQYPQNGKIVLTFSTFRDIIRIYCENGDQMPLFKKTVKSDLRTGMAPGMESWMGNCVDFINSATGLEITYRLVSSLYGSAGFQVDIPIAPPLSVKFGVMMTAIYNASNYLSGVLFKDAFFPLNGYGNHFDCSLFYASEVTVVFGGGLLHVTVTLSTGEEKTLFLVNTATEIETGKKYAGCLGLIVDCDGNATHSGILRNAYSHDGTHLLIRQAETLSGRFLLDNLYTFGESDTPLPEKKPFGILYGDGTVKKAIIAGYDRISGPHGRTVSSGKYISFI